MASIDENVVSIKFDNAGFEKNVGQTLQTLATLKTSLDFKGAGAGLQDISAAAGRFSLDGIGSAVDGIANKFSAMGAVAFSIINNITTKAIDAGLQLAKSFTLAPVTAGFAEYELKMGAIQTIMAGSGESLEVVNQKLQELNTYSDQTIYSFADMTQNIGKFTNAGVSLEDSVASIKGIANVAALSGANAEEASRAMYNFAQALSSGSVKLMDWKSIELANMATAEFKQELIDSAVAAGTLQQGADGLYTTLEGTPVSATKGFNESLTDQWLTTQALNDTLARYSDATTDIGARATAAASDIKTFSQMMDTLKESAGSGWATSFEIILGDFEEAKALFTEMGEGLSSIIGNSADARNQVLNEWSDLGGRTLLIDSLREGIQNITKLLKPLQEAFREVFPRKTGEDLFKMTEAFSRFVKLLEPGTKTISSLKSIFTGLFSAVSIVIEVVKGVFSVFKTLFGLFAGGSSGSILGFFAKIGDAVTKLREALVTDGGLDKYFAKINEAISGFSFGPLLDILGKVGDRFKSLADRAQEAGQVLFSAVSTGFSAIVDSLSGVTTAFDSVKSALGWFFSSDTEDSGVASSENTDNVSRFSKVLSALGGIATGVVDAFKTLFSGLGKVGSFIGDLGSVISDALSQVWDAIATAVGGASAPNLDAIFKVLAGGAVAAIAGALVSFAKNGFKIDFGQFDVLDELADSLHAVTGGLKAMQKDILAGALQKVAIAIGVLTLSLLALSFVDGATLAKSMTAVAAGLALLVAALAGLDKIASNEGSAGKIALLALALTAIAGAMLLLAMAATLMATTDPAALTVALLGMMGALEAIGLVMGQMTKNTEGMVKAAFAVGVLAGSLLLLSLAVRAFSGIDLVDMAVGIGGITASLAAISQTMGRMPADGMIKAALSIGLLSVSLMLLALAIEQMSDIGLVDTATGLITLGVALKLMSEFLKQIAGPDVLKAGAAMLLMSVGVGRLASGINSLGSLDLLTLVKGLGTLAVVLKLLAKSLEASKQSIGGAVALAITAGAIILMATAIEMMGRLPFMVIVQGLLVTLAAIGLLAAVSAILTPVIPLIAGLGASLALVGVAALAFGAGVFLLARGIQILGSAGTKGVSVFLESLDDLLAALPKIATAFGEAAFTFVTSFLSGFDELIPLVVDLIGQLLVAIRELIPQFLETVGAIIIAFLDYVTTLYPAIVQAGWDLLIAFLSGIKNNIGELATTAIGIVTEFINAMAQGIPEYVRAMVNLFTTVMTTMAFELGLLMTTLGPQLGIAFIDGLLTGITDTINKIQEFFGEWAGKILDFIKGLFGIQSPSTEFASIGIDLILGLLQGILDTIGQVATFFGGLLSDVLGWIGETISTLVPKGVGLIVGLFTGITTKIVEVANFFMLLPFKILGWIGDVIESLLQTGKNLIIGFLNGAKFVWETVKTWVEGLAERVVGYLGRPLTWLLEAGKDVIRGLWNGIESMAGWLGEKAGQVAGWVKDPIGSAAGFFFGSPSKVMFKYGTWVGEGLGNGIDSTQRQLQASGLGMANAVKNSFYIDEKELTNPIRDAVESIVQTMDDLDGLDGPVITPVLDLSGLTRDAKSIGGILNTTSGFNSALSISAESNASREAALSASAGPTEIKYEQVIIAPTALSTSDIYRQTRSLIAITKEEASIP